MSVTPSQPTIVVKKSDGTTVRMTLAELAASKKPVEQVVTAPPSSSLPPVPQINEEKLELLDADALPGAEDHHIVDPGEEGVSVVTEIPVDNEEYLSADALLGASDSHEEEHMSSSYGGVIETSHALATTTPVVDIYANKAAFASHTTHQESDAQGLSTPPNTENMVVWEKDDHTSLLEDTLDDPVSHIPSGDDTRVQVEQVMSRLSTTLSAEDQKNVRALILSRIKDVRTDDQLFSSITREKESGGLGLSKEMGEEIVRIMSDMREGDMGIMPVSPVRTHVRQKTVNAPSRESKPVAPVYVEKIPNPLGQATPNVVRQSSLNKRLLQDITPPPPRVAAVSPTSVVSVPKEVVVSTTQKRTVGPVDEFQQMTLVSFRQLAPTAEEAVDVLIRHIKLLEEESYILFLEAKDAWKQSELAVRYQQVLTGALQEGITIPAYLARHSDTVTPEEFSALVRFSGAIS